MRPLVYVTAGYPTLSETFTRAEARGLRAAGVPVRIVALHAPRAVDPALDERDPPVERAASPLSRDVLGAYAWWWTRRPWAMARLTARCLFSRTRPFLLGWTLRTPVHLLWGAWLARRIPASSHLHAQFMGAACTVAWSAARLARVPFSFTVHSEWGFALAGPKMREADFVVSISEFEKRRLLGHARGVPESRVVVNRLGAAPSTPRADATEGATRLLAVGTLGAKKGHDVLVEACARLRERGLEFTLDVVGEGPERRRLEAAIARLGLGGTVRLRGALPHAEVRCLVRDCDVAVLACRVTPDGDLDGIPIFLMEAMAAGRATVSCRVAGIPELIVDGESGLVVEPDAPDALADALARLLADPHLRLRLGEAGRARQRSCFDLESSTARFVDLLAEHLGGRRDAAVGGSS